MLFIGMVKNRGTLMTPVLLLIKLHISSCNYHGAPPGKCPGRLLKNNAASLKGTPMGLNPFKTEGDTTFRSNKDLKKVIALLCQTNLTLYL
jgi:hypothetical protein